MTTPNTLAKKMRLDIQGIRALAVLSVMIYHANKDWLPAGFLGVDIFFVISGFIISHLLFNKSERKYNWKSFIISRIKRILPAYIVLLFSCTIAAIIFFTQQDLKFYKESLKSAISFDSNRYFSNFGSYFAPNLHELPLLHTWSLAIEMQFYILLPLILILSPKKHLKYTLPFIFISLFTFSTYTVFTSKESYYFSLILRIPEFFVGVLLAFFYGQFSLNKKISPYTGLFALLVVLASFFCISENQVPGIAVMFPCFAIALLLVSQHGPVNSFLSNKLLVWIGGISYSLYLWHWPILAFMRYITQSYELPPLVYIGYVFFSFLFAWLSCKLIETPLRLTKNKRTLWLFIGMFILSLFLLTKASEKASKILYKPLPVEYSRYANASQICHGKIVANCIQGNKAAPTHTIVIGDSHAAQLNLFFNQFGLAHNISFEVLTSSSCLPIDGFNLEKSHDWAKESCKKQTEYIKNSLKNKKIIIFAGKWNYHQDSQTQQAIKTFIENNKDKKIIIFSQIPMFNLNVIRARRINDLGIHLHIKSIPTWLDANKSMENLANQYKHVSFLNTQNLMLFDNAPFYKGELIYSDNHHLNEIGSKFYAQQLDQKLLEILNVR